MTTTIIFSESGDGYLSTTGGTWNDALNGAAILPVSGSSELYYGGEPGFHTYQAFIGFPYTRPTNEVEVAVAIGVRHSQHQDSAVGRELHLTDYNWGGTVDAADWRNPLAIAVGNYRKVRIHSAQVSGTSQYVYGGSDDLIKLVRDGGTATYRFFGVSHRSIVYDLNPDHVEYSGFWSSETSLDPTMIVSSVARSTLLEVLGAQVQLSDGTWCVLEHDGNGTTPTVVLRHVTTAGTATTKATIPTGASASSFALGFAVSWTTGAQALTLAVDASDNLYVIGRHGASNNLACKAYVKGVGYNWTAATLLAEALPASDFDLNNFAAAWHNTGGAGLLACMASRATSDGSRYVTSEICWATLNCSAALAGSGTLIRHTDTVVGWFVPTVATTTWTTQTNDTGTGLDITALSATKGVVHTFSRRGRLGALQPTCRTRYIIDPVSGIPTQFYDINETSSGTWGVKSAATKLRVIPIDADTCAVVSADSDTLWGLTVAVLRNSGSSGSWTLLGRVRLGNETLTTMPTPATVSESAAWDATFFVGPQKLWVYYFDTADGRRLVRTAISLQTYTATREEVEVAAGVGAVGSTNLAIRVARNSASSRRNLVTVANRTSGGTLSTLYYVDTPNEAPTAPTLTPRANFDAATAADFTWTFTDPDIGDTQTAFQLDVNTAVGVDVYDTGKMGAPVTYVGIGAKAEADAANLTPALPASWAPGDLLVVFAMTRDTADTVDVPAGWTALRSVGTNFKALGRIARTGDVAPTITFTGDSAGDTNIAQCAAWRGTDQNIATVLAHGADQTNASAANVAYPALTISTAGCAVVVAAEKQDDWTSIAAIAGMTEIADSPSTLGNDAALGIDYVIQTTATNISSGSITVTGGVAAVSKAMVLAFRPYQAPTAGTFTLPANMLTNGVAYQWRVRTYDQAGATGAWSSYGTFSAGSGGTVTVTDPASDNPANIITSTYPVAWSLSGATQAGYRVVVKRTDNETEVYNSGWVTSVATTQGITGMVSDIEHRIEVTTRTAGLVESQTGTRLITPSYATPDEPAITVTPNTDQGHTLVAVTNPTPAGDRPDVEYNSIQRRSTTGPDADEDWVTIGVVDPNGQWEDYTAASNVIYDYRALAVAGDGNTTATPTVTDTLCLQGVWIHDPVDPADVTAIHFPYGGVGKGDEIETSATSLHYAGRALPIYEFGEHETELVDIPIQVPFSDTWATELAELAAIPRLRTTLCVRDARGRRVFGVVTKISRSDQKWGTDVSFQLNRVDYDETYTGMS